MCEPIFFKKFKLISHIKYKEFCFFIIYLFICHSVTAAVLRDNKCCKQGALL